MKVDLTIETRRPTTENAELLTLKLTTSFPNLKSPSPRSNSERSRGRSGVGSLRERRFALYQKPWQDDNLDFVALLYS